MDFILWLSVFTILIPRADCATTVTIYHSRNKGATHKIWNIGLWDNLLKNIASPGWRPKQTKYLAFTKKTPKINPESPCRSDNKNSLTRWNACGHSNTNRTDSVVCHLPHNVKREDFVLLRAVHLLRIAGGRTYMKGCDGVGLDGCDATISIFFYFDVILLCFGTHPMTYFVFQISATFSAFRYSNSLWPKLYVLQVSKFHIAVGWTNLSLAIIAKML